MYITLNFTHTISAAYNDNEILNVDFNISLLLIYTYIF